MKNSINRTIYQKLIYILLVLVSIIYTAQSQTYKVKIAILGNSITYGTKLGNPIFERYSTQLDQMLSEIYGDTCEIKNYGVSGRTMMRSAEKPLWNESKFESALKYVPDICMILLGTNDSKPYRWDTWGDEFLDDYLAMIDTFKYLNPNARFIVCYPPPVFPGLPYGTSFSESWNDSVIVNYIIPAIDTVVEKVGAVLIDFHTPFIDRMNLFPDKLHPSAEGHKVMAKIVYNKIIATNLIRQIEQKTAIVTSFNQLKSPVALGSKVILRWNTIFANSVFLNGVSVNPSGSIEVIAEENKVYTLTAKGQNNTSDFILHLNTYVPEKSGLIISTSSPDYVNGSPVVLFSDYTDQYGEKMPEKTTNITWSFLEGVGNFGSKADTSVVFIPVTIGKVVVEARGGGLSAQKTLNVNTLTSSVPIKSSKQLKVFPNPVNRTLHFQTENYQYEKFQIKIFNLLGEQLLKKNFTKLAQGISSFELNTSGLNEGTYMYVISFGNETKHGEFIKYTH